MSTRLKVYVAGPLTIGDVEENVRRACKAGAALISAGYAPLIPHLTAYLQSPVADVEAGFNHETWLKVCLPWVASADAVLRLAGQSRGADVECDRAQAMGIPVVHSIPDLAKVSTRPAAPLGDPRFHAVLQELGELHDERQQGYGTPGDPFANVRASEAWGIPSWQGAMIRACDKIKRLQTYANTGKLTGEKVEDAFKDLANYAAIALVLFREKPAA